MDAPEPTHENVRYEGTDIDARPVAGFGVILIVVTTLVSMALVGLLRHYKALEVRSDPPPPPMAQHEESRLPPEPRLQERPFDDFERLREEEGRLLDSEGWVDEKAGVAHIKIEDAMRLLAERGLPARAEAPK